MQHCNSLCNLHNLKISFGLSISSITLRSHVSMMFLWLLWSDLDSKKLTRATALFAIFHDQLLVPVLFLAKI